MNFLSTFRLALYSPGTHEHEIPSTHVVTLEHQTVIHLLLTSLRVLFEVTWRRVLGRRRHPEWSWAQEVAVTVSLHNGRRAMMLPPDRARAEAEGASRFISMPKGVHRKPANLEGVRAEWFEGPEPHSDAVILYFHGGGYVIGSSNLWVEVLGNLALASGSRVLSVGYRLAPEHPYPAGIADALEAYGWLLELGIRSAQIVFSGDSSGGALALAALVKLKATETPMPAGAVLFSPWVDLSSSSDSVVANAVYDWADREYLLHFARLYAGDNDLKSPLISPLFADLAGLPPIQLHVGSAEILRDEVGDLAQRLLAQQSEVELKVQEAMPHGWLNMGSVFPEAADTFKEAAEFVERVTVGEMKVEQAKLDSSSIEGPWAAQVRSKPE